MKDWLSAIPAAQQRDLEHVAVVMYESLEELDQDSFNARLQYVKELGGSFSSYVLERISHAGGKASAAAISKLAHAAAQAMPESTAADLMQRIAAQAAYASNLSVLKLIFGPAFGIPIPLRLSAGVALLCGAASADAATFAWLLDLPCDPPLEITAPDGSHSAFGMACINGNVPAVRLMLASDRHRHEMTDQGLRDAAALAASHAQVQTMEMVFAAIGKASHWKQHTIDTLLQSRHLVSMPDLDTNLEHIVGMLPAAPAPLRDETVRSLQIGARSALGVYAGRHPGNEQLHARAVNVAVTLWRLLLGRQWPLEGRPGQVSAQSLVNDMQQQLNGACFLGYFDAISAFLAIGAALEHEGNAGALRVQQPLATALKNSALKLKTGFMYAFHKQPSSAQTAAARAAIHALLACGMQPHQALLEGGLETCTPCLSGGSLALHRAAVRQCPGLSMHAQVAGGCNGGILTKQRGVLRPALRRSAFPISDLTGSSSSVLKRICVEGNEEGLLMALPLLFVGEPLAVLPWGSRGLLAHVLCADTVRGHRQGREMRKQEGIDEAHGVVPAHRMRMLCVLLSVCGAAAAPPSCMDTSVVLRRAWRRARWQGSAIRHPRRAMVLLRRGRLMKM